MSDTETQNTPAETQNTPAETPNTPAETIYMDQHEVTMVIKNLLNSTARGPFAHKSEFGEATAVLQEVLEVCDNLHPTAREDEAIKAKPQISEGIAQRGMFAHSSAAPEAPEAAEPVESAEPAPGPGSGGPAA